MPAFTATAPGKIILVGEHAVVYRRPAIAVPVIQVRARAAIQADLRGQAGAAHIQAPEIDLQSALADLPAGHPLRAAIELVMAALQVARLPACTIRITSTIPVAAGLGSGAAVSVALARALSAFLGHPLADEQVSAVAYEIEKLHHGTPSGIDNTVITYAMPVYFVRGEPIQRFKVPQPFTLVIGDTGVPSSTAVAVGDLRNAWQADPAHYDQLFDRVGQIVDQSRRAVESGQADWLGRLMDENHALLQQLGVSSPELDTLVEAAKDAGALGSKLSGAGRGGNMIALANPDTAPGIAQALEQAGAVRTIITEVA